MSIHKKSEKSGGEDNAWLETYADSITLLMAFFVILLSISTMDKKKYEIMRDGVTQGLNAGLMDKLSPNSVSESKPKVQFFTQPIVPDIPSEEYSESPHIEYIYTEGSGAEFVFSEKAIFAPNSASTRPGAKITLKKIIDYLQNLKADTHVIVVEGYVDSASDVPKQYGSRWAYSAARAIAVRQVLEDLGVEPQMMHIAAFGDTQPSLPDVGDNEYASTENNEQNRRVVVRVKAK